MKDKLIECISLLTKAKELVSKQEPNVALAIEMLEKSQLILTDFATIPDSEKLQYKDKLLEIQSLGNIINAKLEKERDILQNKKLENTKMTMAVKGYSKN